MLSVQGFLAALLKHWLLLFGLGFLNAHRAPKTAFQHIKMYYIIAIFVVALIKTVFRELGS